MGGAGLGGAPRIRERGRSRCGGRKVKGLRVGARPKADMLEKRRWEVKEDNAVVSVPYCGYWWDVEACSWGGEACGLGRPSTPDHTPREGPPQAGPPWGGRKKKWGAWVATSWGDLPGGKSDKVAGSGSARCGGSPPMRERTTLSARPRTSTPAAGKEESPNEGQNETRPRCGSNCRRSPIPRLWLVTGASNIEEALTAF